MPRTAVRTLLAATLLSACTTATPVTIPADAPQAQPAATPPTPPSADEPAWTDAGGGLSLRLAVPPGPYKLGATIDVGLEFRNDGRDELRIYLIQAPVFRAMQSDLALFAADGKFLDTQPEPHPHGYVVSERDFPAIPPDAVVRFSQPLLLDRDRIGGASGDLQLRWTYRNSVESWSGGVQTLDGPTHALFGGGPIPGIWRGEVRTTATVPLTR